MLSPALSQRPNHTRTVSKALLRCAVTAVLALLIVAASSAQNAAPKQQATPAKKSAPAPAAANQSSAAASPESQFSRELQKYPGLLPALSQLLQKLQQGIQSPAPRTDSRLLPLLPDSTMAYAALPNYGDVARQTLAIFRQELQESAVLRDWWTHGSPATSGPKIEQALEQFDQFQQYLGEEIVLSGSLDAQHKSGTFLALAEIRKAGLDKFLQQWIPQISGTASPGIRILTPDQLDRPLDAKPGAAQGLTILVRPDFAIAATDLAVLRSFNTRLKNPSREFAASAFGQRLLQEYQGGVSVVAGADIQKILSQKPLGPNTNDQKFQDSGFADMKYAIGKNTKVGGQSVGQAELSFTGPRHGAAAWLGKPAQLGSLDFVSPKPMLVFTFVLSSFPQIFDDIKAISGPSSTNVFGAIEGGQKALKLNVKEDLLAQLAGELTIELDNLTDKPPAAKVIFRVNDAAHLQKTLTTLLAAAQMPAEHFTNGPVPYDVLRIPNQGGPIPIAYAFLDGYWIIASKPETLLEAIQLHSSGGSLAHSPKFLAALPAGSALPPRASALFYQDPAATFGLQVRQASPEMAEFLAPFVKDAPASVSRLYGEDSAIRASSASSSVDVSTALIVAAVAIPNLLRSRMAANEAGAVGTMRVLNTAQVAYSIAYPKKGFARNMATLGVDSSGSTKPSEDHAGLLDRSLANETCIRDVWCGKSGYDFRITTGCSKLDPCKEYLAVATPVDANTGTRSFCSTSDAIIRYRVGVTTATPLTVTECRAWPPLK
jgi:type IV pilus assembly protein PilA